MNRTSPASRFESRAARSPATLQDGAARRAELRVRVSAGDDARQRGLAETGRAVEEHDGRATRPAPFAASMNTARFSRRRLLPDHLVEMSRGRSWSLRRCALVAVGSRTDRTAEFAFELRRSPRTRRSGSGCSLSTTSGRPDGSGRRFFTRAVPIGFRSCAAGTTSRKARAARCAPGLRSSRPGSASARTRLRHASPRDCGR